MGIEKHLWFIGTPMVLLNKTGRQIYSLPALLNPVVSAPGYNSRKDRRHPILGIPEHMMHIVHIMPDFLPLKRDNFIARFFLSFIFLVFITAIPLQIAG